MRTDTLYVTDMDGTLLDNNARVSPRSAALISDLTAEGAMITVATARTPASVDILLHDSHISLPAIVMTGAAMWDMQRKQFTDTRLMGVETLQQLLEKFAAHDVNPFVYILGADNSTLDVYHTREMNHAEELFYQPRTELPLKRFHLDEPIAGEDRAILLFGTGDAAHITALADDIRAGVECSVSCYPDTYNPDVALIEVFAPGVSKARAMKALAGRCGARRIVAFGDNLNDLPMLEAADLGVSVANARPEVTAATSTHIGPNSADSVPLFIAAD